MAKHSRDIYETPVEYGILEDLDYSDDNNYLSWVTIRDLQFNTCCHDISEWKISF